ncbi:pectate lyase superfamily protein-domain-containing protein [Xylaria venustula]|nr:pectate lyase superfamily protein-domain-containing protein [Xylaria venustula]
MLIISKALGSLGLVTFAGAKWDNPDPGRFPNAPSPVPNPPYMVDNQHNDKGKQNDPVWAYSGSFDRYIQNFQNGRIVRGGLGTSQGSQPNDTELAPLGNQPVAGSDYKFFKNVVTDYEVNNTKSFDASEAINFATLDGDKYGEKCRNTFTQGAIIYFPPGTYKICSPLIQYYYTQFSGDAINPPTIKGCDAFSGIALIDTDPYIPGGAGSEWGVNIDAF